jgi:hypothetical protein
LREELMSRIGTKNARPCKGVAPPEIHETAI